MSKNRSVKAELHRIAAQHGGMLNPADVVEAARPKRSLLHRKFDWDDSAAAEKYRLWQARQLISVTVEFKGTEEKPLLQRVFVSLSSDREQGGYRDLEVVLRDPPTRAELLQDALDELSRIRKKYRELEELSQLFAALDVVKKKTAPKRTTAPSPSI